MKITLTSENSILFEALPGPMSIEAPTAETTYSPFHMLASGLAFCTQSVLHSWASNASVPADDLSVSVSWEFQEKPHRVGSYAVNLRWPSLPEARFATALRVAELCAVHATLTHSPAITITREESGR